MKYKIIKDGIYSVAKTAHSSIVSYWGELRRIQAVDLAFAVINFDIDIELKREIFDINVGKYVVEPDNNEPLKVILDGVEHTLTVEDGLATIDFMSESIGTYKLVSMCENSKNCEVEICVTEEE